MFARRHLLLLAVLGVAGVLVPTVGSGAEAPAFVLKAPVEVPGLRSEASVTFVNPDGSFTTKAYQAPINFRDTRGVWQKIDASLLGGKREGFAFESGPNAFHVDVRDVLSAQDKANGGFLRFEKDGVAVGLSLEGARSVDGQRVGENAIRFPDALPLADVEYALIPSGVKETVVLQSAKAASSYTYNVVPESKGLRAALQEDGSVAFFRPGRGEPVFSVLAPTVADSREGEPLPPGDPAKAPPGSTPETGAPPAPEGPFGPHPAPPTAGAVSQVLKELADGSFQITVQVDPKWLADPARVFPVFVDPTVSQAVSRDGYWNSGVATSTPNLTDGELLVGTDGSGGPNYQSVMQFDLGATPPGAQVTSAQVTMPTTRCFPYVSGPNGCPYWWSGSGNYQYTIELHEVTSAWGASTQWQNVAVDATVLGSFSQQIWQSGSNLQSSYTFTSTTLASRVQAMISGATINNGFVVKKTAGDATGLGFGSSRNADTSKAPSLVFNWVADGVYLPDVMHVHPNGPELTWTRYDGGLGPYGTAVLADSPVGYWRFNDLATSPLGIADWSGNGQSASRSGVALQEPGATADGDQSVFFGGATSSSVAIVGSGPAHNLTDTFSAELWFKRSSLGGQQTLIGRGESNGGGLRLAINGSNRIEFAYGGCNTCINSGVLTTSTVTVTDTTGWHHVVATKAGSSVHLYLDGNEVTGGVSNATLTVGHSSIQWGRTYYFTDNSGIPTNTDYFSGWIDEPAFYSTPLTLTQVQAHEAARNTATIAFNRYEIHRASSSGFTPSATTLVATLGDRSVQAYRDTTARPSATFFYKVLVYTAGPTYTSNQISVTTPAAGTASITIQPDVAGGVVRTASISSTLPCANQGGSKSLTVDPTNRALVHFDLRAIPAGASVSAATLSLFTFSTPAASVTADRVTADWTEGTENSTCNTTGVSWAKRTETVDWATVGGDIPPPPAGTVTSSIPSGNPRWATWNVTSFAQGWMSGSYANLGLLLKHATETGAPLISFPSDEYTTSFPLRPKLTVTYTDGSAALGPRVAIGAPGPSALVKGAVTVTAGASDDGRVTQVQFKLDGNNLGVADTTAPYSVSWSTTDRAAHSLTAVATDDAGETTTSTAVAVTTANSAAPIAAVGSVAQGGGSDFYRSTVMADSPSAYWRLGESSGTTAVAEVGPNGTYTASGVTLGQTSPLVGSANTSMLLDGVAGYVSVPSNAALDLGNGPFTIEAWVKRGASGHTDDFIQKTSTAYRVRFGASNKLIFGKGSSASIITSTNTYGDTNWHHVAVTKNGATANMYIDGALVPGTFTDITLTNVVSALTIGFDPIVPNYLSGRVDEVALYKSVLSATQISNHYQAATNPPAGGGSVWTVNATVTDDVAVSKVEFLVDGNLFATDTASPWTATLDTATFPVYDGSHTITVEGL